MDSLTVADMLEEFRLMEGTLFQDEEAKLFYLDIKTVVLESLNGAWDKFCASDILFQTALDRYYAWEGNVAKEEVERCIQDVQKVVERHYRVAVSYSRQLYGNGTEEDDEIVISKPKFETMLKTMFRRLVKNFHVKSGSFFTLDPVKQDFITRDAFRQALAESIKVIDREKQRKFNDHRGFLGGSETKVHSSPHLPIQDASKDVHDDMYVNNLNVEDATLKSKNNTKTVLETEDTPGMEGEDKDIESSRENETISKDVDEEKKIASIVILSRSKTIPIPTNPENVMTSAASQAALLTLDSSASFQIPTDIEEEKNRENKDNKEKYQKDDKEDKDFKEEIEKVPEDYNIGDSISVVLEKGTKYVNSQLKIPTLVRTVYLS
jgi:hypothetical protein